MKERFSHVSGTAHGHDGPWRSSLCGARAEHQLHFALVCAHTTYLWRMRSRSYYSIYGHDLCLVSISEASKTLKSVAEA